jgi:hypothetical protein
MLLLRSKSEDRRRPDVWTAQAAFRARAGDLLEALTDPELISRWAPVDFDADGLAGGRLLTGCRARVSGTIAGVQATFDVDVARADTERLELAAHGPVSFDVAYAFRNDDDVVAVDACVSLHRQRGLSAQVLRAVAAAMLSAGALGSALARLESLLCQQSRTGLSSRDQVSPVAAKNWRATAAGAC